MLVAQTQEKLRALGFGAMAAALDEQVATPGAADLPFQDRIGLLIDREWDARETRRLQRRLKGAKLKQTAACIEDVDFSTARGLDRGLLLSLAGRNWVAAHQNCIVTGPTGAGKTFIACALANRTCRNGRTVAYHRVSRLLEELAGPRATGGHLPSPGGLPPPLRSPRPAPQADSYTLTNLESSIETHLRMPATQAYAAPVLLPRRRPRPACSETSGRHDRNPVAPGSSRLVAKDTLKWPLTDSRKRPGRPASPDATPAPTVVPGG